MRELIYQLSTPKVNEWMHDFCAQEEEKLDKKEENAKRIADK